MDPGPYRMVLCPECLLAADPGAIAAGHRAHGHRSLPGRHGGGGSEFQSWRSCLLKVSGANETGEPNGEPTTTDTRPRQATSSHSHRWWMPPGHVQPRPATVITRLTSEGPQVRTLLRPLSSELEMIVREPNGEPKLMVILSMGYAKPRVLGSHICPRADPGGRAWQRMPSLAESSRPGRQAR